MMLHSKFLLISFTGSEKEMTLSSLAALMVGQLQFCISSFLQPLSGGPI